MTLRKLIQPPFASVLQDLCLGCIGHHILETKRTFKKTALRKIFINAIESSGWIPNSLNTGTLYEYLRIEMQRIVCPLKAY